MKDVDLVFRSVGERTRDLALEFAERHIQPREAHRIEGLRPFAAAVQRMLQLDTRADLLVAVDADCLILEDLRPFLEKNDEPDVDCYVQDRFRGRVRAGVHIYQQSFLQEMRAIEVDPGDPAYVLRPETWVRRRAWERIGRKRALAEFRILHDHFQLFSDVFVKYAQRELRSRSKAAQRAALEQAMAGWEDESDLRVARAAIGHARRSVPKGASARAVRAYLEDLPGLAEAEAAALSLPAQAALSREDVLARAARLGWPAPDPTRSPRSGAA